MLEADAEIQKTPAARRIRPAYKRQSLKRSMLLTYKNALFLHDTLILLAVAFLTCHPNYQWHQLAGNFIITASLLFFFINIKLYSYHLIFSLRGHLLALGNAFLSATLMLSIVAVTMAVPEGLINTYLVPVTLLCTALIVLIDRRYNLDLLGLLFPVGFAFLAIGSLEILRIAVPAENPLAWLPIFQMLLWSALLVMVSRIIMVHFLFNVVLRRKFRRQVLVVGNNQGAHEFTKHILDLNAPFWIAGTVECRYDTACSADGTSKKDCLGELENLPELTHDHNISEIVVTSEGISKHDLIEILDFCTSAGINAWFSPELMPIIDIKLRIDRFCGRPMVRLCSQKRSWLFYKIKHTSDALVTLPLFLLQLPLFLFLMAIIKLESKGPVFYVARAIGKGGEPFDMLKFRSMYVDSDKSVHQQYVTKLIKGEINSDGQEKGPIKIVDDPRVTKIGKILRKLSLDELPQLINVLKGQMSLVGPRPCLPYEYDIYQDWHKKRTAVRPGITGLWQVTGRSEVLFEDMILLDLYYIYNNSLMLDLQILFETVFVVLGKKGAY